MAKASKFHGSATAQQQQHAQSGVVVEAQQHAPRRDTTTAGGILWQQTLPNIPTEIIMNGMGYSVTVDCSR